MPEPTDLPSYKQIYNKNYFEFEANSRHQNPLFNKLKIESHHLPTQSNSNATKYRFKYEQNGAPTLYQHYERNMTGGPIYSFNQKSDEHSQRIERQVEALGGIEKTVEIPMHSKGGSSNNGYGYCYDPYSKDPAEKMKLVANSTSRPMESLYSFSKAKSNKDLYN